MDPRIHRRIEQLSIQEACVLLGSNLQLFDYGINTHNWVVDQPVGKGLPRISPSVWQISALCLASPYQRNETNNVGNGEDGDRVLIATECIDEQANKEYGASGD